jgi:uncharacterized protein YndB with AHSA1/START domain
MTPDTVLGTITRAGDHAEVVFARDYDTDAADLWAAVTEPERLARWFAPVDGDLRDGGRFTIRFDDNDVPDCRVTSCDAPRAYSWEWPHAAYTSLVTVAVEPAGTGARLHLTHTRLAPSQAPDYAAGWEIYVSRLAELTAGEEVRDTWVQDWGRAREGYAAQLG